MFFEEDNQNPDQEQNQTETTESVETSETSPQDASLENENQSVEGEAPKYEEFSEPSTKDTIMDLVDDEYTLGATGDLTAVYNVPVQVSAVLGNASMPVSQLLKLGRGAVVELDRRVGESIDVFVNNRLIARGEVVVIDERLGVTMTEIIKGE